MNEFLFSKYEVRFLDRILLVIQRDKVLNFKKLQCFKIQRINVSTNFYANTGEQVILYLQVIIFHN